MLVDVYDTRTGKKLPNRVPLKAVGDPIVGPHLSLTPRAKSTIKPTPVGKKTAAPLPVENTETPVAGEGKE